MNRSHIARRAIRRAGSLVAVTTLLFSAVACGSDEDTEAGSGDTVRIGILAPYSGVFATFGPKVIEEPIRLYLKQNDNKIGGKNVEIFTVDDQSKPEVELEKAKELVEDKKVDVIVGLVNSAGALAVRDYLDQNEVLTLITVAGAKELTQDRKSDSIFRVSFANGQTEAAGAVLAKEAGLNSMAAIGADYVAGHELLEPLIANFEELGGEVPLTLWSPLSTPDFSSYLTDLKQVADSVDAISPMMFGADAVRFFQQYKEFGIETPIYAFGDVTEQTLFLDTVGTDAIGTMTYWNYSPYLDNPANEQFREGYYETYDRLPGAFSVHAYAAMQFLEEAAATVDGNMGDTKAMIGALESVEIDSPAGPLRFDEDHALVFNVYLNEVKEGPDGIVAQIPVGPHVTDVHQHQTLKEAQDNLQK